MTTFTVQIKESDAEMVISILKKFKAKVIETPKQPTVIDQIAEALLEVKEIREGRLTPLTLKDL